MRTTAFTNRTIPGRQTCARGRTLAVLCSLAVTLNLISYAVAAEAKGVAGAVKGQTYYTKFSLFHEGYAHRTTNYRKGILVPINTPVTFTKATRKMIRVKLPDGKDLEIANVEEFSGESINGIWEGTFGQERTDLSTFTKAERKAIETGTAEPGMTKAAVIAALGYPPKHRTPSLTSDQWRYWQNRFNTFLVHFEEDKVVRIQE